MIVQFSEVETSLRDGTQVYLRWIRPDDADRLGRMVAALSDESRQRRFGTPIKRLTDDQIHYFTDVDFDRHIAWIALRADDRDTAIGVARCVRVEDEPSVAEAALTVLDAYQNSGLGTLLLALLAVSAQSVGIERFRAYFLDENGPMRELLENIGVPTHFDSPGLLRAEVPVSLDSVAESPAGLALKALARELVRPRAGHSPAPVTLAG
jgi:GNAT superfamily N-acetyltransferase